VFIIASTRRVLNRPVRAVYTGRPSRRTTASSFSQPSPTRCAKNTARHVRPSCVRRGWSDRLERTQQRPAWSRSQHRQLRSPTEDALVSAVFGALSALEALCDNALYIIDIDIDINNILLLNISFILCVFCRRFDWACVFVNVFYSLNIILILCTLQQFVTYR